MSKKSGAQIPADIFSLPLLLGKLGFQVGPIKAYTWRPSTSAVHIWFVPVYIPGQEPDMIRRVSASFGRGCSICGESRRRVYRRIILKDASGQIFRVTDSHFKSAGLMTPDEYEGE